MKGLLAFRTVPRWTVWSALFVLGMAGQAMAAGNPGTISGKLTIPASATLGAPPAHVVATSATYDVYRTDADTDGTYTLNGVTPGTYTISVIAGGLSAPDKTNVVVADSKDVTGQDFTLDTEKPFPIVKSTTKIPLTDDINSMSFADAPVIHVDSGKNVSVDNGSSASSDTIPTTTMDWGPLGGPNAVSGLFRVKYSSYGFHIAGDVTFKTPLVNNYTADSTWRGNCLEFSFMNAPYDPNQTLVDYTDRWKLDVSLGAQTEWWEGINYAGYPNDKIDSNIKRVPKDATKGPGGELVRIDIPWSVFARGIGTSDPNNTGTPNASGPPTPVPADNALGAIDIMLDAADPTVTDPTTADRKWQLVWSGQGYWTSNMLNPVQFVTQAPAAGQ